MSNSIIEAQQEYFEGKFLGFAPNIPILMRWKYTGWHHGRVRDIEREKREDDEWRRADIHVKDTTKGWLWDLKLRSEVPP